LRTVSLCFEFWKNYRATEPFPGIEFQTTNERRSPDDLPCSEVKQSNPISAYYRSDRAKHNRSFAGICYRPCGQPFSRHAGERFRTNLRAYQITRLPSRSLGEG